MPRSATLYSRFGHIFTPLTERERSILMLAAEGRTSKEIAHSFSLSSKTIKNYQFLMYKKLGVTTRLEAVAAAIRLGEIPCPYCKREHRFSHRSVKDHKRR